LAPGNLATKSSRATVGELLQVHQEAKLHKK